ncbi:hypothetical protein [uncultured Bacteroides sp.]|uniref:hypothetical protein n=1 Tax=uncultured Bacteroides sp. TaxID=162156 RepID=UPI003748ACC1
MSEDGYLLLEILFNPRTLAQVENIRRELKDILEIITNKDIDRLKKYMAKIHKNIQ